MLTKIFGGGVALALALVLAIAPAGAAERASLDDAKAMAESAASYMQSEGPEKAMAAYNSDAQFKDRDLYVFLMQPDGTMVAHGANPGLIGKNLMELRDPAGKPFVQEMVAVADRGWVDYSWQNPTTKAIEAKRSYIIREGGYVIGVGAYAQ